MAISGLAINSDNFEECRSLQKEELEVLAAIYPGCIVSSNSDEFLDLEIPIEFGSPRTLSIADVNSLSVSEAVSLTVLPPILLRISFPPSYPLYGPPKIISMRASSGWLLDISTLAEAFIEMWESGETVLYKWVEYVRTGDFLQEMEYISADDGTIKLRHSSPAELALSLSTFESTFKLAQFSQESYPCSICLTQLKGIKCHQLECKHVFCRDCLGDFWKMCITEGDVSRVGCPDPACVKEKKQSCEEEVARVVSDTDVQRWRWLRKKQDLERDPTVMPCPIPTCETLVPKPSGVDPESGWDRFRQCQQCMFSFCSFCKFTWHGPLSSCPIVHMERLILEYLATEEGSQTRATFEAHHGRSLVHRLVSRYEQEKATNTWISSSTTHCPGCKTNVQKSEGCNHMTCTRCQKHFCYRCGEKVDPRDPYAHFSVTGTPCYDKLFDWVPDSAARLE